MLAYLLIICVAFYVVSTSLIRLVGEYLFSQKVREEQRVTEDLAARMAGYLAGDDAEGMYRVAQEAAQSAQAETRVLVVDQLGVVQADAQSEYNGNRLNLREVALVLAGENSAYGYYGLSGDAGRWSEDVYALGGNRLVAGVYAASIRVDGELTGALVYFTMAQDVYESLTQMQSQMMVWLVLVTLAVTLLSLLVSGIFVRPIDELSQGISRMTQGDLSSRVAVRGHSEFAQLAEAFNMMCERLQSLDNTRNQFVSNASHELKTPLATMKILVETLLYQEGFEPEVQKEFLGDINREIDRLNSIIGDLLTLVHFDSGSMKLKTTLISLDKLVEDTAHRLEPLAHSKQITLECAVRDSIETMGDAMKLQQVFYNLTDNAIKYTPSGGTVRIELTRAGRKATIRVIDNGMGIPKADLLHVFDRFYRVDKARSRETGGTGLGLSIVKQIVLLHEGTVNVTSEEDKGSVFTVELPIVNPQYGGG